ncbi:hypothetical protein YC2023_065810 [Brassica napus]
MSWSFLSKTIKGTDGVIAHKSMCPIFIGLRNFKDEENESTREYRVELETKRVRRIRNVRDTRRSEQKLKTLISKEMGSLGDELSLGQRRHSSIPTTICRSKIMNVAVEQGCKLEEHVQKLEEEKRKIQGSELELPLCLQMLNDGSSDSSEAISYLKKETETDTQPLLKDFISLSKPFREEHDEELFKEKKFQLWRENDHISNARFSDTLEIEVIIRTLKT